MDKNVEFTKLMFEARTNMEDNGFSPSTVNDYMNTWCSMHKYAQSQGITEYSADFAEKYMREKYGMAMGELQLNGIELSPYMRQTVRAVQALTDFKLHGYVAKIKRGHGHVDIEWSSEYEDICKKYLEDLKSYGYQKNTWRRHEIDLYRFTCFLHSRGITPENINSESIYEYFKTTISYSKSSLSAMRSTLIRSLRFFYEQGITSQDQSVHVPRVRYFSKSKIDKVWSEEEVASFLRCVDRANPIGKRDYAILLVAADLGLRTSDIVSLTINDFNWRQSTISIIQQKTGEPLTLPISEQVGKAIIDYWKNGRPKTVANELFVQHTLPYQKMTNSLIYHIFNTYLESSGIRCPDTHSRGLHSLRHSLASRLLEKDVPVNIISNILGHVDSNTAKTYIQIDIEKLRQCSLEVPDYE